MTSNQESALIDSIKKQAEDEAQQILEKAEQVVQERKKNTDDQIERIKREHQEKEKQQVEQIVQQAQQKIASLERKQMLGIKEQVVEHVVDRVKEKFIALADSPNFREIMIDWTVEAALGLEENDPILKVTESCKPFADETFCDDAADQYKTLTGNDIHFTLSPEMIKKGHGIILEAQNGRTAFNNLLQNRLYRHKDTIEAIVLEDIFNE